MFEGLKLMHKNWVIKGYDQSVTCLADDLKTLVTRSSTLRTSETLSQTNNSIHKYSSIDARGKLQKQANNSCNRKQFLTIPKLDGFGLIRKFRSIASIGKKNQLNQL